MRFAAIPADPEFQKEIEKMIEEADEGGNGVVMEIWKSFTRFSLPIRVQVDFSFTTSPHFYKNPDYKKIFKSVMNRILNAVTMDSASSEDYLADESLYNDRALISELNAQKHRDFYNAVAALDKIIFQVDPLSQVKNTLGKYTSPHFSANVKLGLKPKRKMLMIKLNMIANKDDWGGLGSICEHVLLSPEQIEKIHAQIKERSTWKKKHPNEEPPKPVFSSSSSRYDSDDGNNNNSSGSKKSSGKAKSCSFCNGTGKTKCSMCNGTGSKGNCSKCGGSGHSNSKCTHCK
jgi:hypothetical protein